MKYSSYYGILKYIRKLFYIGVNFEFILKLEIFQYRYKNLKASKSKNIGLYIKILYWVNPVYDSNPFV